MVASVLTGALAEKVRSSGRALEHRLLAPKFISPTHLRPGRVRKDDCLMKGGICLDSSTSLPNVKICSISPETYVILTRLCAELKAGNYDSVWKVPPVKDVKIFPLICVLLEVHYG